MIEIQVSWGKKKIHHFYLKYRTRLFCLIFEILYLLSDGVVLLICHK